MLHLNQAGASTLGGYPTAATHIPNRLTDWFVVDMRPGRHTERQLRLPIIACIHIAGGIGNDLYPTGIRGHGGGIVRCAHMGLQKVHHLMKLFGQVGHFVAKVGHL